MVKGKTSKTKCVEVDDDCTKELRDILRRRIFHNEAPDKLPTNLLEKKRQLLDLVTRCAQFGESNSILILGPRGSGKSLVMNSVLKEVMSNRALSSNIMIVQLNGLLQTDDRLALREITRQLQLENTVGDKVFGSFAENLAFLLQALRSGGHETKSIVFVLDEFDLFALHKNQTLLYNLFDVSQSAQTPLVVMGLTCRLDVVELLEKRVKSRFSHRQVHLFCNYSFEDYVDIFRSICALPVSFKNKPFRAEWNTSIENLCKNKSLREVLLRQFNTSKEIRSLHSLMTFPVTNLTKEEPYLKAEAFIDAYNQNSMDSKAAIVRGVSVLELCLLIAMNHLRQTYQEDSFNFEMVYHEYQKFAQRKGHTLQCFEKAVVMKAFEHLLSLELVYPSDGGTRVQKEYRLMNLLLDPQQINEAVTKYAECPTEVKHWATSAIHS